MRLNECGVVCLAMLCPPLVPALETGTERALSLKCWRWCV